MTAVSSARPATRLPTYHPTEELLLDYAAGALSEPVALVVATHLTLCPTCRSEVGRYDAIGGSMLDDLPAAPLASDSLAAVLARIDGSAAPSTATVAAAASVPLPTTDPRLPRVLAAYLPNGIAGAPWRAVMRGLDEAQITTSVPKVSTRLMRIKAGQAMPQHTHEGLEMICVLDGSFSDKIGRFQRGDFALAGSDLDHRPIAEGASDCLCLAITDAPVRLTGPVGRFLNLFLRY